MKVTLIGMTAFVLFGCGVETATTAVTAAKVQAEQAKKAPQAMDMIKADINVAATQSDERLRPSDGAN